MCHQCRRSEIKDIIVCSYCKKKRYCYSCISNWYVWKTQALPLQRLLFHLFIELTFYDMIICISKLWIYSHSSVRWTFWSLNKYNVSFRYPERTRKEVEEVCPFCRGNCNCKLCLQDKLVMKVKRRAFSFVLFLTLLMLRIWMFEKTFVFRIDIKIWIERSS